MGMSNSERKLARLSAVYDQNLIVSSRTYNAVMGGTVLAGLLVNVILCITVGDAALRANPVLFMIGYAVCCFAGIYMSTVSAKPIVSLAGYALVVVPMGLVIAGLVSVYGGLGSQLVQNAFLFTMIITAGMVIGGALFPDFFSRIGGILFCALIGLVVCELVCMIFRIQQDVTAWFAAALFSLYIGYDFYRSQQYVKTIDNAIDCALDLYIDIANLFVRLLQIFGRRND